MELQRTIHVKRPPYARARVVADERGGLKREPDRSDHNKKAAEAQDQVKWKGHAAPPAKAAKAVRVCVG